MFEFLQRRKGYLLAVTTTVMILMGIGNQSHACWGVTDGWRRCYPVEVQMAFFAAGAWMLAYSINLITKDMD